MTLADTCKVTHIVSFLEWTEYHTSCSGQRREDVIDCFAFPNNRTEEMCKRENDPSRKNVHNFMKIEGKLTAT